MKTINQDNVWRISKYLENKYYNFKGLNLTIETLDGLIKHNGPVYNLEKFDNILGKAKYYDQSHIQKVKKSILRQSCVNKMQFH